MSVACLKTSKAVCAKSRLSLTFGCGGFGFGFVFVLGFALGMAQVATNRQRATFNFQTDPLPIRLSKKGGRVHVIQLLVKQPLTRKMAN
jgi:hypothetical protein